MTAAAGAVTGHVWLVGAGPGDPSLITWGGLEALRRAEVVLYDRLGTASLLGECAPDAELIDVGKLPGDRREASSQERINAALIEQARAGRRVVRLKGGDPYVFGRGGEEAIALVEAGIGCTVVPGVTSAIAGLAAAGIPVTHRAVATSFAVVTGHEDPTKDTEQVKWERLALGPDTLVVLMGVGRLDAITTALIAGGRAAATPAALVQEATTPAQRVITSTLGGITEAASVAGIEPPALLVVGDVVRLRAQLAPVGRGPLAGKRVLVTRTREQASTLVTALAAEGALPLVLPAIAIERRADAGAVAAAIAGLRAGRYGWVVFTSEHGVGTWFGLLREAGADARVFAGTRLCAIGPATARALAAHGLAADLVPPEAIGEATAEALIAAGVAGAAVLLPRAHGGRDVLPDRLRAAGAAVDDLPLYLAAPPAELPADVLAAVRAGEIDVVTFTSSSTVRNLAQTLGGNLDCLRGATVACIGPATAETATEHGLPPHIVATEHSIDGLVAALRGYLQSATMTAVTAMTAATEH